MITVSRTVSRMLWRALLPLSPPSDQTMVMPLPVPLLTIDMLDDFLDADGGGIVAARLGPSSPWSHPLV